MSSETDLIKLYSGKILKMAAEPIHRERPREATPEVPALERVPVPLQAIRRALGHRERARRRLRGAPPPRNQLVLEFS